MWREQQIAITAKIVRFISYFSPGLTLIRIFQNVWPLRPIYRTLLGYRRPFASLQEAHEAVLPYARSGHQNVRNVQLHLELSARARPSDYAVFFHLQPIVFGLHTVFDLGGSAGNLFYSYSHYLKWPSDLNWQVKDLPATMVAGEALAAERGAHALHFTADWSQASQADLLIVSGSMHYLEKPLDEMVAELARRPTYLMINRTPLTGGAPVATIQDAGEFRIACMLYNRLDLIGALAGLGYVLIDQWSAAELSLEIPGYPEHKISSYTGMFLQLNRNQK